MNLEVSRIDKVSGIDRLVADFESGSFDNTQDGKCICCGECCSNYLPLRTDEIARLRKIVEIRKLKPHTKVNALMIKKTIDATCPFLTTDNRCEIYADRPEICKVYKCNMYKEHCNMDASNYHLTDVRHELFGIEGIFNNLR